MHDDDDEDWVVGPNESSNTAAKRYQHLFA